jgi:hypothetical protein
MRHMSRLFLLPTLLLLGCFMPDERDLHRTLTKKEALEIAKKSVAQLREGTDFAIQESDTVEKPFGWVFFYNTKKFIETGDPKYIRPGNGPLVVERLGGNTTFLSTSLPPAKAIEEFERQWQRKQKHS